MKRLMLVDDERPVTDGMSLLIRRDFADRYEVAGVAASGREALEKIGAWAPDIVLMDVSMPGLSGLETIREIRSRGFQPAFILVTAYERFDIAREAVELEVVAYLLKPVNRDRLGQALQTAARHLDERGAVSRKDFDYLELRERLEQHARTAFLEGIMLGLDPQARQALLADLPREQTAWGQVLCVAFLPPAGLSGAEADQAIRDGHSTLATALRYKTRAHLGPLAGGRALILLWLEQPDRGGELATLQEVISQTLRREIGLGLVRLGCGSVQPQASLDRSWHDALADLANPGRQTGAADGLVPDFDPDSAFLEELANGSPLRARTELDHILAGLPATPPVPLQQRFRLAGLLSSACRQLARQGMLPAGQVNRFMDLRGIMDAVDPASLGIEARSWLAGVADQLVGTPRCSPPVAKTLAWIRENYASPLSLEGAADLLGMSASHLSRLFIAETGKGFSDCLISWRIERAKELLRQPGASIKQVSLACGYQDPNYFARLFKKETGHTPTAWAGGNQEAGGPR